MKNRKFWISLIAGLLAAAMILSLIVGFLPSSVSAATSAEISDEIDALEEKEAEIQAEIDALSGQLSENLTEMQDIVDQKNIIDQQVALLYSQIATINEQIAGYNDLIADKQDELDAAQARYDELSEKNKERIRAMEEDGALSYWSVLFKASNFSDLLDRISMVEEIAASDQRRLEELSAAAAEVESAKTALEEEKANLEATMETLEASQAELDAKSAEATALLEDLRAEGEEFELYMAEAEERQSEVMLQIDELEIEYEEARQAELAAINANYAMGGDTTPSSGGSLDGWVCPVPAGWEFSSPFGMRIHPIWGDWRMHYGIDMSHPQGTPIYAARDGVISGCGWNDSMGWYIWMDHNDGFETVYMHMTHFIVTSGEEVSAGQVIGYMGSTGDSTGPHLHFGVRYYGEYVNPIAYIPY